MADFGLPEVQSLRDPEGLVSLSRELAARQVIYSVAKITRPKQGALPPFMEWMNRVCQHLSAGEPRVFHGGVLGDCRKALPPHWCSSRSWSYAAAIRCLPNPARRI